MKRTKFLWMAVLLLLPGSRALAGGWICQNQGVTLRRVEFVDTLRGWAVGGDWLGEGGVILHTRDGGKTWSLQPSGTGFMLWGICFVDSLNGWVGGDEGVLLHTRDGGKHWEKQESGVGALLSGVTFRDTLKGWIPGGDRILHTTDGGSTWTVQVSGGNVSAGCIAFADSLNGWAVGRLGTILHTVNGGRTGEWSGGYAGEGIFCRHP